MSSTDIIKTPSWSVAVVIPARNEEHLISQCLLSVLTATTHQSIAAVWIVVVADSCNDGTAQKARAILGNRGEVIACRVGSPGSARRLGARAALTHFAHADPRWVWLANTDADTVVPLDWFTQHIILANVGVSVVAGIVKVIAIPGHSRETTRGAMSDYLKDSDETHHHVHGANLGVRADAYLDAGGWNDLATGEDHCLWNRVKTRGWTAVASVCSVVITSGRLTGRARAGFAATLRAKVERLNAIS